MAIVSTVEFGELLDYRFDAECYQPELLNVERRVVALTPRPLDAVASVSDGNHVSIAEHFCNSGVRYLKGAELSDVFIEDTEPTYIPRRIYAQITRAHVAPGDVLLSVIGTVGPVALVTDKYERLSCSCKVAILRPHGISAPLLTAYLLSPTGQALLLRRNRGSVQQGVVLPDVRNFPVPKFSDTLTTKVEKAMHESAAEKQRADCLYLEAGAELLDRLRWEKLQQQAVELSYARDFGELTASGRADAEFFQPQYARLRAQLNQRGAQPIGAFCSKVSRGVQPELIEGGEVVVVDSKAVRPIGVEPTASERTSRAFWSLPQNTKGRIQDGDVLLNSTGRGTLGRASYYRLKEPGLCDNHVAILRPEAKVCHPIYLALFLNSPAGLAQSEQFQTGSSGQLEIYPQHISQFLIFLPLQTNGKLDLVWQQRLAAKVESAAGAKAAARAKLEEATRLVEDAIR